MKKLLSLVLALAMVLSLTAACAEEKVTLELMLHKSEVVAALEKAVAAFSQEHPEIEIKINQPAEYGASTQSRFLAGDMPDMWTWSNDQIWYPYFAEDYFMDLSDQEWLKNAINETSLAGVTFDGKVVGLPYFSNAWGVFYNEDLFQQYNVAVPATLDEFWAACETFKAAGITPIEFTDADAWTAFNVFERLTGLVYNDQGELFEKIAAGETSAAADEGIRKVADIIAKLHTYGQADPISTDYTTGISAFANGEAAMFLNGTWAYPLIQSAGNAKISSFAFPAEKAEDTKVATNLDLIFNICAKTEHPEACLTFLSWLADPANAQTIADDCGAVSLINGVNNSIPAFQAFADAAASGKTYSIARNYWRSGTNSVISPLVQMLCENSDVDSFLSMVDEEVKMHYAQ